MIRAAVILLVCLLVGFCSLRELTHHLQQPRLETIAYPDRGFELVLYHRGSAERKAALFLQKSGDDPTRSNPYYLCELKYGSARKAEAVRPEQMEHLSWTKDGSSLVLLARQAHPEKKPPLLLIYDLYTGEIFDSRSEPQTSLEKLLALKQGLGSRIRHWQELGKRGETISSWEATHWDRLCGERPAILQLLKP